MIISYRRTKDICCVYDIDGLCDLLRFDSVFLSYNLGFKLYFDSLGVCLYFRQTVVNIIEISTVIAVGGSRACVLMEGQYNPSDHRILRDVKLISYGCEKRR